MAVKSLIVNVEKCTGCRICEMACSLYHEKVCSPSKSKVHIIKWETLGLHVPILCLQCDSPLCKDICPVDAMSRDERGAITVNYDLCVGCKLCVLACPLGGVTFDTEKRRIVKCDLCGGDPRCVKFCPTGALLYETPTKAILRKKRAAAEELRKSKPQQSHVRK